MGPFEVLNGISIFGLSISLPECMTVEYQYWIEVPALQWRPRLIGFPDHLTAVHQRVRRR